MYMNLNRNLTIGLACLLHCIADSCDKSVSVTSGHGGIIRTELDKHLAHTLFVFICWYTINNDLHASDRK